MDTSKIEDRIDRVAAGATEIDMSLGGVKFQTMLEIMEFSKLMAVSGAAVPVHLRGNPGACLAVCTRALRFGFDPFSLAEHSYTMVKNQKNEQGQWERVETIAYDSFVIRAIIQAHADITGQIEYRFEGEGDDRKCFAYATPKATDKRLEHESPKLGDIKKGIGRNDKGQLRGSPLWDSPKSDQQLAYDTGRDFCRRYFPHILLGWYDKDEFEEEVRARAATDITPASGLKDRLKGQKGRGFNKEGVEQAITHQPGQTIPETKPQPDPVSVADEPVAAEDVKQEVKAPSPAEPQLSAEEIEAEIKVKIRAIGNAKTKPDMDFLVGAAKAFLKENNRNDLLGDVLSAQRAREKHLKPAPAETV